MNRLRRYIKNRPRLQSLASKMRDRYDYAKWVVFGRPAPPPHSVKRKLVLKYAGAHQLRTFVETGTYKGQMVDAVHPHFDTVYSIELSDSLFTAARERFKNHKNVQLLHGDSGAQLRELLSHIDEPCLFWLDAHYSGDETALGDTETPILAELECIFDRCCPKDVVLIDDARCFNGTHTYPTMEALRAFVERKTSRSELHVNHDVVAIEPSLSSRSRPGS